MLIACRDALFQNPSNNVCIPHGAALGRSPAEETLQACFAAITYHPCRSEKEKTKGGGEPAHMQLSFDLQPYQGHQTSTILRKPPIYQSYPVEVPNLVCFITFTTNNDRYFVLSSDNTIHILI